MKLRRHRVETLTVKLMAAVKEHYLSEPSETRNVFEALNAFGFCVGTILAGTGAAPAAREFFEKSLNETIEAKLKDAGEISSPILPDMR